MMGDDTEKQSSRHARSGDKDPDQKTKRRHKHQDEGGCSSKKRKRKEKERDKPHITDGDLDDEDMWVEKNIDMDGERVCFTLTLYSLSHHYSKPNFSSRELSLKIECREAPSNSTPTKTTPGGPGSQWRMMRLRRVYETAEEENRPLEGVALDQFGSLGAFEEAKEERRILDEREGKRSERGRTLDHRGRGKEGKGGAKGFIFTDLAGSGASSRSSSFRRPASHTDTPSTPSPQSNPAPLQKRRFDSLRLPSQAASPLAQSHTPTNIPNVMTPVSSKSSRALSPSSLNRLQAKVLRAKLMGGADTETLEREYDEAVRLANGSGDGSEGDSGIRTKVEVLPTLDVQGRLYDVGSGKDDEQVLPGNRKRKYEKVTNTKFL